MARSLDLMFGSKRNFHSDIIKPDVKAVISERFESEKLDTPI